MQFLEDKLLPIAAKLAGQRQLGAIRDAFVMFMPLTIAAAFAVLINWTILGPNWLGLANVDQYGVDFVAEIQKIRDVFNAINNSTLGMIAFFIPMAISYHLAKASNEPNPLVPAMMIGAAFVLLIPASQVYTAVVGGDPITITGWIPVGTYFGASNLFTSLIVGLVLGEFLLWLMKLKALKVSMPDSVPPNVANAFSALFPGIILFLVTGVIYYVIYNYGNNLGIFSATDLTGLIKKLLQEPILAFASGSAGGIFLAVVYVLLVHVFWLFGIHGSNVLAGVVAPIWTVIQTQNQEIYNLTGDAFNGVMMVNGVEVGLGIFSSAFFSVYVFLGGCGITLSLIIAIMFFSKRADYKAIANFSAAPGIFNINEPIVFGIPIVLNPILAIPFVLAPIASLILPYILTSLNIIPKVVIMVPWVSPPFLGAFLGTGGSWLAGLVSLANIAIGVVIYMPFVILANKAVVAETSADEAYEEGKTTA